MADFYLPSPLHQLETELTKKKEITLYIKRDDLIHPHISGNKYRKLKYNLLGISSEIHPTVVTFGGAFSNHIHALAAACFELSLPSVAFIRGELDLQNPTLIFCVSKGMDLVAVSRGAYRLKEKDPEIRAYLQSMPNHIIIPEGGTNALALKGVAEILDELDEDFRLALDYIVLSSGTGGTTAGLLQSDKLSSRIISFSALKSDHLKHEIMQLSQYKNAHLLEVNTDFHFGGYAKWDKQLLQFIDEFERETDLPLDQVYNGKAMFGLMNMIANDKFDPKTKIMYIHTGGLQGKAGIEYIQGKKQNPLIKNAHLIA